jgi:hypothetical protein
MTNPDLSACLQNALTHALAAQNPRVRIAYMDLAEFYDAQRRRLAAPRQSKPIL